MTGPTRQTRLQGAWLMLFAPLLHGVASPSRGAVLPDPPRRVIDLNGTWQVEEGSMDRAPARFTRTITVPGLLDMAHPAFEEVGKVSARRQAFWYRRTFKVGGPVPAVALLKLHKARYGASAWLNGQNLGEHLPCFTPAYFDVRPHLRGGDAENELVIRLGANPECLPRDMPRGWDFEKYLFTPGLYDTAELILSGTPFIRNVQVVPEIASGTVRAIVEVEGSGGAAEAKLRAGVHEARRPASAAAAAAAIAETVSPPLRLQSGKAETVELRLAIPGVKLWTPEAPNLYELRLSTGADAVSVRFGMRSFRFNPDSGRAELNGKPYFLRGTNICIDRFFEDAQRGGLPWRADWVKRLHAQFRTMHWNAIRYCIGFPPDFWYDIADEVGFLIQDEFPIWLLSGAPESPRAEKIIPQYVEWMRERWNHPCVVIWDAQNESFTDETGKAIRAVRHLDLSGRPWENGWSEPQARTDCVESHPYLFSRGWEGRNPFRLSEMTTVSGLPHLQDRQKALAAPILINEYGWLWLNRDGSTTCLTGKVYESILGPGSTAAQRRLVHARYLAALTEFWRCHRRCAGVLHFCGLGYSRAGDRPRPEGGATSDHWIDLERLVFEPTFLKYVRDAFNPVGLMLDYWAEEAAPGIETTFRVYVINDLETEWKGEVRLRLMQGDDCRAVRTVPAALKGFGREVISIKLPLPSEPGGYTLDAELSGSDGSPVHSLRDLKIVTPRKPAE